VVAPELEFVIDVLEVRDEAAFSRIAERLETLGLLLSAD